MRAFQKAGMWEVMRHHLLVMLREQEGRQPSPTAAIIDTQSGKTKKNWGLRGWDAAKNAGGERRSNWEARLHSAWPILDTSGELPHVPPDPAPADLLLPSQGRNVDGVEDQRRGTISVFYDPEPEVRLVDGEEEEIAFVGAWISQIVAEGVAPHEVGIFVRTADQLNRAKAAARHAGQTWVTLQDRVEEVEGRLVLGTMHLAKGMEFKAVAVMACDDEVIPLQERIERASEEAELDEIFETERHLLYVAATRARDRVCVTGTLPGSEFLADLIEP